jgi:excinuclease ABC subunit A
MSGYISIHGARVNNLKNIDVQLPRNKLVVMTGLSGSGKSSLAFDTIYAEGQRRYVESLSSYAKQFLGLMDKPDVDKISGLSPAISIDQRTVSHNPRSTVGTITEIYDYLRLLFARVGIPHCPRCHQEINKQSIDEILEKILKMHLSNALLMAPIIRGQKGEHRQILQEARQSGYMQVRIDDVFYTFSELDRLVIEKHKKHNIDIVIDKIDFNKKIDKKELRESLAIALELANGLLIIHDVQKEKDILFSQFYTCPTCQISIEEIEPRLFSFNSPHGACPKCTGLGTRLEIDPELVLPNKKLSIAQGAIRPWSRTASNQAWMMRILEAVARVHNFSLNTPVKDLPADILQIILYGTGSESYDINASYNTSKNKEFLSTYEGVIPNLERRYKETDSDYLHAEIENYMRTYECPTCLGRRLKPEALAVTVTGKNISEITSLPIDKTYDFFKHLKLVGRAQKIAEQILKEVILRLEFLQKVGLGYLTLDRSTLSLSGGELQRIRLATQIGSSLTGVVYVLDEPSIGLHQKDNKKLIETLKKLRDLGNTVIVVEHDEETILSADWVVDIGPGAGNAGGKIVAVGTPQDIKKNKSSITGKYLSHKLTIPQPKHYRRGNGKKIIIQKAQAFNLKNIDATIPLGKLVCLTGVSGSGKSTLMTEILAKALAQHFYRAKDYPGKHEEIVGLENLDKVIHIDQSPIGRTPRSNPATYTGVFTSIRDLFAEIPEAKMRGYKAGCFSFNVKGGRCEACQGDGVQRIEMHFLPDVYIKCEECNGRRYNKEALEIHYRGKNIADVLEMTVDDAFIFFSHLPAIKEKLQTLRDVGLGYIRLGQNATTLSGGEAQRVKLATELSRRSTGRTIYLLDEPTTGLHFADVEKLLGVLHKLVDKGNSVLIIEHNLDVIKAADWVIDLGPEGGEKGGYIVAEGTPKDIASSKKSYTGQYLKKIL